MAINPFHLLSQASSAARSAKALEAYVTGGALTDALEAVGDVHFRSAIDHLRQAQRSTRPSDRIADAAAEVQTAYFFFARTLERGVPSLRRFVEPKRLKTARGKAAGSAATVAVLRFHLGEHPENVRAWLDRVAHQVAENWRDWLARDRQSWWGDAVGWWDTDTFILERQQPLDDYFALEERTLPPELIRPRPLGWTSRNERAAKGLPLDLPTGWDKTELYMLPKYEPR